MSAATARLELPARLTLAEARAAAVDLGSRIAAAPAGDVLVLDAGALGFLQGRRLGIEVSDLGLCWVVTFERGRLIVVDQPAEASVRGTATDLLRTSPPVGCPTTTTRPFNPASSRATVFTASSQAAMKAGRRNKSSAA